MTKLRIDLFSGTLEVEGEEGFVRSVYDDFKDRLLAVRARQSTAETTLSAPPDSVGTEASAANTSKQVRTMSRKRAGVSPSLVKDIDLSEEGNDFSLADFYAAKSPQTAMESNVVFVYYLQQIAQVARITVNHIYTCYKFVNIKYPNALKQSLADTSSRKNWLDTSSFDDIKLSTAGENFVEHSLPRGTGQ
jgi:hypothetical protein